MSTPASEPQSPAFPLEPGHDEPHRGMITFAVMSATVMQVLDMTIVNVALPHMQGNLSATVDQISWVLTSYIVAAAVMTPPTGWLAGRFGRKRLLLISVAFFSVASMACGLSTSLSEIVAFRLLQGMFGAALAPLAQAILLDTYPRERHGSAMAIYGMGLMVGPILGPTLGGYLPETYSWRWVFFINLPVGILAFSVISAYVHETARSVTHNFDVFGFAMLSLGIGALQLMLDRGGGLDWFSSSEIIAEASLSALGFYIFAAHSATTDRPFVNLGLFRDRNYAAGVAFMFAMGVILLATLALMPPFMENLLGFPVLTTGLIMAPRGIGTMFSMMVVGRISRRADARVLVLIGLLLIMSAFWKMSGFNLQVGTAQIIEAGVLQGLGMGLIFVPITTIAFSTLAAHHRTEASALFNLVRNIGSSIGISLMFTLLTRNVQVNHAALAEHITPYNPLLQGPSPIPGLDITTPGGLALIDGFINRQAAMIAYLDDFKFMMLLALLIVPLVFLFRRSRPARGAGD